MLEINIYLKFTINSAKISIKLLTYANGCDSIETVHCLALGGVDLTSPAGKMTMQVISAVAEFERDLLLERTHSGVERAKNSGKRFGRPPALTDDQKKEVIKRIGYGESISSIAKEFGTTRQTIMRVRAANQVPVT